MSETTIQPRLKARYAAEIRPALQEEFNFANPMQVPRVTKVVVNMGVGEAARDSKLIEGAIRDLTTITGQRPSVSCVKVCQLALTSPCAAIVCGNSSIVCSPSLCHVSATSAVSAASSSMVAATTPSV